MKGLLLPAILAVAIHAAILGLRVGRSEKGPRPVQVRHAVTLALAYLHPASEQTPPAPASVEPESAPVEKQVRRIQKEKSSRVPQRQTPKENVDPPKAEGRETALAALAAVTDPHRETITPKGEQESRPATSSETTIPEINPRMPSFFPEAVLREAVPIYKENPAPTYPQVARRRGMQGSVFLDVLVSPHGRVKDLRVAQSSGHDVLDQAAVMAVRAWTFEPARRGDEAVEMWVKVPVRFELK